LTLEVGNGVRPKVSDVKVYRHLPKVKVYRHLPKVKVYRHLPKVKVYRHLPKVRGFISQFVITVLASLP
jgi:hypothetical protein